MNKTPTFATVLSLLSLGVTLSTGCAANDRPQSSEEAFSGTWVQEGFTDSEGAEIDGPCDLEKHPGVATIIEFHDDGISATVSDLYEYEYEDGDPSGAVAEVVDGQLCFSLLPRNCSTISLVELNGYESLLWCGDEGYCERLVAEY